MQAIVFFIFEDTLMKMESEECGRARIVHHVPKKKSSIKMQQAPKRPPRTWRRSVESTSIKKGSTGFYFIKQTEPRNMKRKAPKQTTTNEYK